MLMNVDSPLRCDTKHHIKAVFSVWALQDYIVSWQAPIIRHNEDKYYSGRPLRVKESSFCEFSSSHPKLVIT